MITLVAGVLIGINMPDLFFKYQEASKTIIGLGLTITVSQYGEERSLRIVDRRGNVLDRELIADWGPDLRTNIYQVDSNTIAIMDFANVFSVPTNPLSMKYTSPSKDWKYLGTFVRMQRELQFAGAGEVAECMDILMDEPPPKNGREDIYRERCQAG